MNDIMIFAFQGAVQIRSVFINGNPMFVARDVCAALGYRDATTAVRAHCKGVPFMHPLQTTGGVQNLRVITMSDLSRLAAKSDLKSAERFESWVFDDVLPSIYKTGTYSVAPAAFPVPHTFSEALRLAADQADKIERMRPKVEAAEALLRCDCNMSITDAAKHFNLHPKTQVFAFLRDRGFLTAKGLPTQDAIDCGILSVRQNKINDTEFRPQAVVEASQLERWRTRLVPKIIEWSKAELSA